jgi:hypothetical protein
MKERRIELFGRLRDAGLGEAVLMDVTTFVSANQLLKAMEKRFFSSKPGVLKGCVLASEDAVLSASDRIPKSGRLAVLPPVCGG